MIDLTTLTHIDPDEAARRLAKMRASEQIQAAVLAEREACAKVAAEGLIVGQQNAIGILHAKGWNEACRDIAARIRGRK